MRSLFEFLIDSHIKIYEDKQRYQHMYQQMGCMYLSHRGAAKAQASLRICTYAQTELLLKTQAKHYTYSPAEFVSMSV